MYIHRASRRGQSDSRLKLPRWAMAGAAIILVIAVGFGAFFLGASAQKQGSLAGMGKLLSNPFRATRNFGTAHLAASVPSEQIFIDLKFKHYQRLLEKREQALERGFLFREEDDYVPGEIRLGAETLPVRLRLKGDLLDHLRGRRWSFRIQVRDGKQFHGMRRFSIQHPKTRNFAWEWAVLEAMRREDVLAPRYGFIEVTFNGKPLGVYAYEEHFGKELLESQARREGVIVKLNEDWRWQEIYATDGRTSRFMHWQNAPIEAFNEGAIHENPNLMKLYEAAVANIEGFRQGRLAACDVFDCERVARFWALADLTGSAHALGWINLRYYYNPVTTRLEPIAFDCLGGHRSSYLAGTTNLNLSETRGQDEPTRSFMADPRFAELYVRALERLSRPEYVDELREALAEPLAQHLQTLHREWPWEEFDWGVLEHNRKLMRAFLSPPAALTARYDPGQLGGDSLTIRVANLLAFPVEVLSARVGEELLSPTAKGDGRMQLAGKPARGNLDWAELDWSLPDSIRAEFAEYAALHSGGAVPDPLPDPSPVPPMIELNYRMLGDDEVRVARVDLTAPGIALQGAPRPGAVGSLPETRHPFLEVDAEKKQLRIAPGRWSVEGDLMIPPGWVLTAGPGTLLEFATDAVLLSYSPLQFVGSTDEPVTLRAAGDSWGGLQVIGAEEESLLRNVAIHATRGVDRPGWILTGGISFYESPVNFVSSIIADAKGEDALNVVRSHFYLNDMLIRDTAFDALDVDFGEGRLAGVRFQNVGNDALDFSGSRVDIEDVVAIGVGDKGISAGEASEITARAVRIEQANVGIASKDRSTIEVSGCEIVDARIGLAVFQKKPEFGGAFAYLKGMRMRSIENEFLVEVGSHAELDGEPIPADATGVADALY